MVGLEKKISNTTVYCSYVSNTLIPNEPKRNIEEQIANILAEELH